MRFNRDDINKFTQDAYAAITGIEIPERQDIHRVDMQYLFTYRYAYQNIISSRRPDIEEIQAMHTDSLGNAIPAAQLNTWGIALSAKESTYIKHGLSKVYYPDSDIVSGDLILRAPSRGGVYNGITYEGAILDLEAELKSPRRVNFISCDWLHPSLSVLYSVVQLQDGSWAEYDYPVVMDDTIIRYRLVLQQIKYDYHIADDTLKDALPDVSVYHGSYSELPWLPVDNRKKYVLTWRYPFRYGDISLRYNMYEPVSVYVTNKLTLSGIPERVAIDAHEVLPDGTDIEYYVSADDANWIPVLPLSRGDRVIEFVPNIDLINGTSSVSRFICAGELDVQADGQAVPFTYTDNVLSVPHPDKSKWYTIAYNTDVSREIPWGNVAKSATFPSNSLVRLKVILRRLRKDANATPILKSFQLYVVHSTKYHEVRYTDEHNEEGLWSGTSTT